jgi:hypothetical protein
MDKYNKMGRKKNDGKIGYNNIDQATQAKMLQDIANEGSKKEKCKKDLEALASFRPPGIWAYVKASHENEFLEYLVQEQHEGMSRAMKKYCQMEDYMRRISCCDYSGEPFKEQDNVVMYWVVSKTAADEFRKNKEERKKNAR